MGVWKVKTWTGSWERREARSLDVEGGCLVFRDDWSRISHAYPLGQWSKVELDDEGPPPGHPPIPPIPVSMP